MTGEEHQAEAERLLLREAATTDPAMASALIAQAQVHALLALAATAIATAADAARAQADAADAEYEKRAAEEEELRHLDPGLRALILRERRSRGAKGS
jgi:hypothetical protein